MRKRINMFSYFLQEENVIIPVIKHRFVASVINMICASLFEIHFYVLCIRPVIGQMRSGLIRIKMMGTDNIICLNPYRQSHLCTILIFQNYPFSQIFCQHFF